MHIFVPTMGQGTFAWRSTESALAGGALVFATLATLCFTGAAALPAAPAAKGHAQTIRVESLGDGSSAEALRSRVIERLKTSGDLKVIEGQSAADLVLRGTSSVWPTGNISLNPRTNSARETIYQGYLSVELANNTGEPLWSYLVTPSHFRTASITDDLADHLVARLLEAIDSGAIGAGPVGAVGPGAHMALHAAGSTLAAPLYLKWFESAGFSVAYDAIGSEGGIKQLAANKVDFAASDMPLTAENTPANLHVTQIATVLGGVVPIYNLPGLNRDLRLTPEVLAGIYSGAISKWNDPRIAEANRGARLPDAKIAVVHRADGSGTTFVWTSFLSLVSREWKDRIGAGPEVRWPTGTGAAGNNGVAGLVEKTPNSIGYVELIYAIQNELSYASVRNPAGEFIKADLASITDAATGVDKAGTDFRRSILNSANRDAYPISTFTWLLVPTESLSAEKRAAMVALFNWMLTSGQKECASLGYAPLPREIADRELRAVNAMKQ
ncbi:MAG: phosphate ABC transporter substrate-binding protein PstS [Terracidiphilus sp.]